MEASGTTTTRWTMKAEVNPSSVYTLESAFNQSAPKALYTLQHREYLSSGLIKAI